MKQKLVLLAMVILNTQMLFAQREMVIGAEAGGGIRSWYGDKIINDYAKPDFSFKGGLSVRYQFSKHVAIGTGVSFERKGALYKVTFTDNVGTDIGDGNIHNNLDYVTMPLNVIVVFNSKLKPFISAGPFISYLINAQMRANIPTEGIVKSDLDDQYKKFDYGISFGGGIMIPFGDPFGMSLQLIDNLGLVEIEEPSVYGSSDTKNNTLHFLVGFVFRINKEPSANKIQ